MEVVYYVEKIIVSVQVISFTLKRLTSGFFSLITKPDPEILILVDTFNTLHDVVIFMFLINDCLEIKIPDNIQDILKNFLTKKYSCFVTQQELSEMILNVSKTTINCIANQVENSAKNAR